MQHALKSTLKYAISRILRHLYKVLNGITPVVQQGLRHSGLGVMEMILNDVFQCDVVMIFQRVQIYFLRVTKTGESSRP